MLSNDMREMAEAEELLELTEADLDSVVGGTLSIGGIGVGSLGKLIGGGFLG